MPNWVESVPIWTSIVFIYLFTCVCFLLLFGVLLYFDRVSLCSCSLPEAHREPPAFCLLIAGIKGAPACWTDIYFLSIASSFLFFSFPPSLFHLNFLFIFCTFFVTQTFVLFKKLNYIYIYLFVCVEGVGVGSENNS